MSSTKTPMQNRCIHTPFHDSQIIFSTALYQHNQHALDFKKSIIDQEKREIDLKNFQEIEDKDLEEQQKEREEKFKENKK